MKEVLDQLKKLDARFDRMDARFDEVDARFDQVDARFEQVDARFEQVDARFEQVDARFEQVDARFTGVDGELQKLGVLLEAVRGDAKMALEGVAGNREVLDQKFAEVLAKLDERVQPVELAIRASRQ